MRLVLVVGICALSVLCFLYQYRAQFFIDSDEGIVGLMALHLTQGSSVPMFYYGQHYIGPAEALTASLFFSIFGSSSQSLKLAPFIFTVLAFVFGVITVINLFGRKAAIIFTILFTVPGQFMTEWFCKARGNFSYTIFATSLVIYFLERHLNTKSLFLLGLFVGFSWWQNGQITSLAIATGLALGFSRKNIFYVLGLGVGLLPVALYNFANDFATFEQLGKSNLSNTVENINSFFSSFLPILLGFARTFHDPGWTAWLAGFLVLASIAGELRMRLRVSTLVNVLNLVIFLLLFSISEFGKLSQEPRYGMSVWFSITMLTASFLNRLGNVGVLILIFVASCRFLSYFIEGQFKPTGTQIIAPSSRIPRDTKGFVQALQSLGVSRVRTPYWNAYNLVFISVEKIQAELIREPYTPRIRYFDHSDLVTVPVLDHKSTNRYYSELSKKSGLDVEVTEVFDNMSLYRFQRKDLNRFNHFTVASEFNATDLYKLKDDDMSTYWHADQPVNKGVLLTITEFSCAKGIYLCVSKFDNDFPQIVTLKHGGGEDVMDADWINFLKSTRCLDFLFQNPARDYLKMVVKNVEIKRFFPSLSELKLISCE